MRAVIPFIVTVLLVSVLAPVIGLLLFRVLTGTPLSAGSRDLAGVPFLCETVARYRRMTRQVEESKPAIVPTGSESSADPSCTSTGR